MQNQQSLLWENFGCNQNSISSGGGSSIFKFQQDNDSVGSPTLTTNSERSEITEASSDFSFQKRFQENFAVQQQIYPQHSLMQQSGYDEMQLLQQQVMVKQLQAIQRQQQHQQQNFLNPYSTVHKQANSGQFPYPGDEMPLNDSSQGYINWSQRNASPAQQGTFNRPMFPMGIGSQPFDLSLYGTPVANARGNISQQPPTHVMYQEPNNLAARHGGHQPQKSLMQLSELNNSFLKDQYDVSPAQVSLQEGTFMSNLGVQGRGISEAGSVHGLNNGTLSRNLLMGNSQQIDTSSKDSSGRQEQGNWSSFQQKDAKLDPLEEKILFNMEDSSISEIASGVFGDKFESVNFSSSFPSIQSGSWSALMQTAVAEASSSDTGLQEEFSGLTYQNIEPSADNNNTSNFMDTSDRLQTSCVDNTLQGSASLKSKPLSLGSYSDVNSSFPGFQLPSDQSRTGMFNNGSAPDSTQRSSNVTGHWVDCNPQQNLPRVNQQVQSGVSFDNLSTSNMYLQSPGVLDQIQSQTGNYRSMATDSSASNLANMSSFDPSQGGKWANVSGHLGKPGIFPQFIQQNDHATVSVSGALNNKHEPQMLTVNPFVASQPDNAIFPGVNLDAGLGGHTSRSPQQGTNRQFNVWMDLPTRQQHPFDQESLKVPLNTTSSMELLGSDVTAWQKAQQFLPTSYNMPQRVGLHQQEVAATKNISDFTASNKDFNKFQGGKNMDFGNEVGPNIQRGTESLYQNLYGQNHGLKMSVDNRMSSMSQFKSFDFDASKMEQNSSGSNVIASGNLPPSTPMWFKQMQPVHDSQETSDQLRIQGRVDQDSRSSKTMNQDIDIITPKKRKLLKIKHLAWHEEVCNVSQRDHTISETEQEWARVANLLVEKVKYDTQTFEFALPSHRSKRRLVLTSQLMQQLFHPPPTFVLFSSASSNYDSLLFFVARATLGDACSLTHSGENALQSSSHEVEKIHEKTENVGRRGEQHSEVAKNLTEKAKKLQESFERLEKTPSMADIKFEIEDLERFSVINRFARFHSRGPVENSILNSIPERYIVVGPMPRYLPEEVKSLAL